MIKGDYDGILSKMITVGAFVSYGYGGRAVVSNEWLHIGRLSWGAFVWNY